MHPVLRFNASPVGVLQEHAVLSDCDLSFIRSKTLPSAPYSDLIDAHLLTAQYYDKTENIDHAFN